MQKTLAINDSFKDWESGNLHCLREYIGGPEKMWRVSVVQSKGASGRSALCEIVEISEKEILRRMQPANMRNLATLPSTAKSKPKIAIVVPKPPVRTQQTGVATPLSGAALLLSLHQNWLSKKPSNGTVGRPKTIFA